MSLRGNFTSKSCSEATLAWLSRLKPVVSYELFGTDWGFWAFFLWEGVGLHHLISLICSGMGIRITWNFYAWRLLSEPPWFLWGDGVCIRTPSVRKWVWELKLQIEGCPDILSNCCKKKRYSALNNCCNFITTTLTNVEPQKHIARLHSEIYHKKWSNEIMYPAAQGLTSRRDLEAIQHLLDLGVLEKSLETLSCSHGLLKSDQNTSPFKLRGKYINGFPPKKPISVRNQCGACLKELEIFEVQGLEIRPKLKILGGKWAGSKYKQI